MPLAVWRVVARALLLFLPMIAFAAPASAQLGFGPPGGPATAPCVPFTTFPLAINLGTAFDGRDGETSRCGFGKAQGAINTIWNKRAQPNGIASLDANGLIPLGQIPATVTSTTAAPGDFSVGGKLTIGGPGGQVISGVGLGANQVAPSISPLDALVHHSQGCTSSGRFVLYNDCNIRTGAEFIWLESQDRSLYANIEIGGTPAQGDVIGYDWSIGGTIYKIRYTVQAGDTTSTVAANLCNVLVSRTDVITALKNYKGDDNYGYQPVEAGCHQQVFQNHMVIDIPWQSAAIGSGVTPVSAGGTTVIINSAYDYVSPLALDGGPFYQLTRTVLGRDMAANDLLGFINFQYRGKSNTPPDNQGYAQTAALVNMARGPVATSLYINTNTAGGTKTNVQFNDGLDMVGPTFSRCMNATFAGRITACEVWSNSLTTIQNNPNSVGNFIKNTSTTDPGWTFQVPGSATTGRVANLEILHNTTNTGLSITPDGKAGMNTLAPGAVWDVAGTMRGQMLVLSGAPTASNLPASYWTVVKRTDDNSVKICANDNGAIKCAAMQ